MKYGDMVWFVQMWAIPQEVKFLDTTDFGGRVNTAVRGGRGEIYMCRRERLFASREAADTELRCLIRNTEQELDMFKVNVAKYWDKPAVTPTQESSP
jgi:hypothetical protein